MNCFIEGEDRRQATLLPDSLEDYVTDDNPVRVIDVFIDELELAAMGFAGVEPEATGRPLKPLCGDRRKSPTGHEEPTVNDA